jgi:hypothetical protein
VKFKVTDEQRTNGNIHYTIAEGGAIIGTVTNRANTWKCTAPTGLLVNDIDVRKRMYAAVKAHTALPGKTSD